MKSNESIHLDRDLDLGLGLCDRLSAKAALSALAALVSVVAGLSVRALLETLSVSFCEWFVVGRRT